MTVPPSGIGASSDRATHWHGIDWADAIARFEDCRRGS